MGAEIIIRDNEGTALIISWSSMIKTDLLNGVKQMKARVEIESG